MPDKPVILEEQEMQKTDTAHDAKILIVEDEGIVAYDMQGRLKSLGYSSPDIALSGKEAVEKALKTRPDLILMDIMMPGEIDGVTAAEQIHVHLDVPIIYVTAYTDENTIKRAKITEPYGYIVKPFKERELQIIIDMALYKHDMEKKLKESEERLNAFFNQFPAAMNLLNDHLRYEKVNELAAQYMGLPVGEIIGKKFSECVPEYARQAEEKFLEILQTGIAEKNIETSGEFPDRPGETIHWISSFFLINIPGGKREIGIVALDITKRIRAEEALRESEVRFRQLADAMPQLVWTTGPDGRVDYFNMRYKDYQGITQTSERFFEWSLSIHPNDREPTVAAWRHAIETGGTYQIEHRVHMAEGSFRWHLSRGIPAYNEQGRMVKWFGTSTDIHDLKVAQEALREREERTRQLNDHLKRTSAQLAASNKELEAFSYSISHDLRAPLRTLDGFSMALLEDYADRLDAEGQNYLTRIRAAAQRMSQLIDDLLNLSRTARAEFHYTTVYLSTLAESVIEELRQAEPEREVEAVIQEKITVEGDETLLRQVLRNLLGNAWKFTSRKEAARIEFGEKRENGRRLFFVRDNGAGFNMKHAEDLFIPFRRLHTDQEFSGTGIGLSIVKRIIDRHGGSIRAESETGKGATFYFTLGE
ncbi:MAG: ATP-binding protein [Candidatus Latescibacterota bacterium]